MLYGRIEEIDDPEFFRKDDLEYYDDEDHRPHCNLYNPWNTKYRYHLVAGIVAALALPAFSHINDGEDRTNEWNDYCICNDVWDELKALERPYNGWNNYHSDGDKAYWKFLDLRQIARVLATHYGLWCRACKHAVHINKYYYEWSDHEANNPFGAESYHWRFAVCKQCWSNIDRTKYGHGRDCDQRVVDEYVAYRERSRREPPPQRIIRSSTIVTRMEQPRPYIINTGGITAFRQAHRINNVTALDIEKWKVAYDALNEMGVDFDFIRKLSDVNLTSDR